MTDTFAYTQLARSGLWSDSQVVSDLAARRFPLLILDVDPRNDVPDASGEPFLGRLTAGEAQAIRHCYRLQASLAAGPSGSLVYVYRPATSSPCR